MRGSARKGDSCLATSCILGIELPDIADLEILGTKKTSAPCGSWCQPSGNPCVVSGGPAHWPCSTPTHKLPLGLHAGASGRPGRRLLPGRRCRPPSPQAPSRARSRCAVVAIKDDLCLQKPLDRSLKATLIELRQSSRLLVPVRG